MIDGLQSPTIKILSFATVSVWFLEKTNISPSILMLKVGIEGPAIANPAD